LARIDDFGKTAQTSKGGSSKSFWLKVKEELGELQFYLERYLASTKFLVVSVLSYSPRLPRNFKKCTK